MATRIRQATNKTFEISQASSNVIVVIIVMRSVPPIACGNYSMPIEFEQSVVSAVLAGGPTRSTRFHELNHRCAFQLGIDPRLEFLIGPPT